MPRHPIGPWSETTEFQTDDATSGTNWPLWSPPLLIQTGYPTHEVTVHRTGHNSGRKRERAEYVPTSSSLFREEVERCTISGRLYYAYDNAWYDMVWHHAEPWSLPFTAPVDRDGARKEAAMRFIERAQGGFNSVSVVGGMNQTISMLFGAAHTLATGFTDVVRKVEKVYHQRKKMRPRSISSLDDHRKASPVFAVADIVSDVYLEYTYGLKPSIGDFVSAINACGQTFGDVPKARRFSGWATRDYRTSISNETYSCAQPDPSDANFGVVRDSFAHVFFKVKYGGHERPPDENPIIALYHLGLTPDTVLRGLWDLTPWSFLLDYFYDIDSALAMSMFPQGAFEKLWRVEYEKIVINSLFRRRNDRVERPEWHASVEGGTSTRCIVQYSRVPELWQPTVSRPSVQLPSAKQGLNMMALAISSVVSTTESPIWRRTD